MTTKFAGIAETARRVRAGRLSALTLVESRLALIERRDHPPAEGSPRLGAAGMVFEASDSRGFSGCVGIVEGWFGEPAAEPDRVAVALAAQVLGAAGRVEFSGAAMAHAAQGVVRLDALLGGTAVPAHYMLQAQRLRALLRDQVLAAFARYDLLLAPAAPAPMRIDVGLLSPPLIFGGLPIVIVPARGAAMPATVRLMAPIWREKLALEAAAQIERAAPGEPPEVRR